MEGDRVSGKQIFAEVHWRMNALISGGFFSAYQMIFGSNPVDLKGWEEKDVDLTFAQVTLISGQVAQQLKLRGTVREAALKEITSSRRRRLSAYNKAINCAGVKIGDTALIYKASKKKSIPWWRGPALISRH